MDLTSDLRQSLGLKVPIADLVSVVTMFQRILSKTNYALFEAESWTIRDVVMRLVKWYAEQCGRVFAGVEMQTILDYNIQNAQIVDFFRLSFVILGEAMGDIIETKRGISETVVNADPSAGRDLAVLKVDMSDTPSLVIEYSDNVRAGDTACVFGNLGVATFNPLSSPNVVLGFGDPTQVNMKS